MRCNFPHCWNAWKVSRLINIALENVYARRRQNNCTIIRSIYSQSWCRCYPRDTAELPSLQDQLTRPRTPSLCRFLQSRTGRTSLQAALLSRTYGHVPISRTECRPHDVFVVVIGDVISSLLAPVKSCTENVASFRQIFAC